MGHENFKDKLLDKALHWVTDNNAMIILLGDMIENANAQSVGSGWVEQKLTPQEQKDFILERLMPHKHRILGVVTGNHEERTYRKTGFDPTHSIAEMLGAEYFRSEYFGTISCKVTSFDKHKPRSRAVAIYGNHSATGHKTSGLSINAMQRDWPFIENADILLKGHDHSLAATPDEKIAIDKNNGLAQSRMFWMINTGNFIGRPDSYATKVPFRPKPSGFVGLHLSFSNVGVKVTPEIIIDE